MADNSSSNNVAIVAIIILVVVALGFAYYFMKGNRLDTSNAPTKIEVNMPAQKSNT